MKKYEFKIESLDLESTNESLIRLWSSFLLHGKIGWHYRPYKINKIIDVGDVSVHGYGNYNVNFRRKTKEIVTSVVFEKHNGERLTKSEIEYFNKIDKERHKISKKKYRVALEVEIDSYFGVKYIYPYSFDNMLVFCIDDKQFIEFDSYAYSKEHLKEEVLILADKLISILSTQINSIVKLKEINLLKNKSSIDSSIEIKTQLDVDWMDDYPVENYHFILPEYVINLLFSIVRMEKDVPAQVLRSSHHFIHGLELQKASVQKELITTQFMSSIEVLSELEGTGKEKCKECGQPIYSIRKRVLGLVEDLLGKSMKKNFDRYYKERSKYLHSGIRIDRTHTGVSLPQISSSSDSGCVDYHINFDINLVEWIGYMIRSKTREMIEEYK